MYIKLQNFGVGNRAEVITMEIPPERSIRREKVFVQSYEELQELLCKIGSYYTPFFTPVFTEEWWEEANEGPGNKSPGVDLLILHFEKETAGGVVAPRDAIIVSNTVLYYMNDKGDTIDKTFVHS